MLPPASQVGAKNSQLLGPHFCEIVIFFFFLQSLYTLFDEKRREVRAEKAKRIRELTDPDHAWGNENEEMEAAAAAAATAEGEEAKYEALYDYQAQNDDELSFGAGNIILVGLVRVFSAFVMKSGTK